MSEDECINIHEPVERICELLGLKSSYVGEITIQPNRVEVVVFKGRDGHCSGPKYVEDGEAATERLSFKVVA